MKKTIIGIGVAALVLAASASAAPYVILKNNQRQEGQTIRANSRGDIILTRPGQTITFTADQVLRAVADKPPEFDAAVRAAQARQYDAAIPVLKKIVADYAFLTWDIQAAVVLGKAYLAKGGTADIKSAVSLYEDLLRAKPQLDQEPEIAWGYRQAMLADKQYARLMPLLEKSVKTGAEADAARAMMMRGDVRAAEGNAEAALLDYLRTVMFYRSQRAIMPEATLRVADMLEKMRDKRAKEWYKKVVEEYPTSNEAITAGPKAR